ncbi:MAG: hypothetical protein J0M08_04080 [Bacteroidetes bacterium]|nr:hypothetical protein [Bacteroidota bacterium]
MYKRCCYFFGILLLISAHLRGQFYNGSQMDFGKNRVQYMEINWTYYNYDKYQVYFYEGGKEIANYVSESAVRNIKEIEKVIDYELEEKIQFIVYNKQSDFIQSNIGLSSEEQYNVGGTTRIVGTKIILFFEGDHAKLEQQIKAGIAEIAVSLMLYGGNMREVLRNSTLLTLPEWYQKGLVSYLSNNWNSDIDNRVKDGILSGKYNKFNRLTGVEAVYAGHSIWNYVADNYGQQIIPNLLYMTRVSRNIEQAFLFVMGTSLRNLTYDWLVYYGTKYEDDSKDRLLPADELKIKRTKNRIFNQFKVSPDGAHYAYVTNELGQYKVWLYDATTNKKNRIVKGGNKIERINDNSFPLLAWHPSGKILTIILERKGIIKNITYTLEDKKKQERNLQNFEKVLDISYNNDGKKMAMSAVLKTKGQSDIFILTSASNAYEQITNDIFDDLHPRFALNGTKVVFSSNRTNDTLKASTENKLTEFTKDIFAYDYQKKSPVLKRVTNTPFIDEDHAADYMDGYISFLSDASGIKNRYVAKFDSTISYIDTATHYRDVITTSPASNYSRNIIEHDVNSNAKRLSEIIFHDGKYKLLIKPLSAVSALQISEPKNTTFATGRNILAQQKLEPIAIDSTQNSNAIIFTKPQTSEEQKDTSVIDISNYLFESEKKEPTKQSNEIAANAVELDSLGNPIEKKFTLAKQKNYYINYAIDYVTTQLDNNFLNTNYQVFTGGGSPIYNNPGFTGLFKISMSDLFDDYRITAAMRLSADLGSNEYLLSYENRVKNLDKQIILHRQSINQSPLLKVQTHQAKYIVKWPFSEVSAIRGTLNIRNDKTVYYANDLAGLKQENAYQTWATAKVEYIFDNTIKRGLNLYNGTRLKVFAEYLQQVDKRETDMIVLGADIRHYQKIHRELIWANRIAASTSFGNQKLVYYMGGVDNWLVPKFDKSIRVATDQNYAFQTIATPMRGFYQNIRNGNSFVLLNSELRCPIFRYLLDRPIRSDFVNNFQVIGFGDLGVAWAGKSPFGQDNSINKVIVGNPGNPIKVTLKTNRQPIIGSYGIGLRSKLLGYFVRLDWAWGVENGYVLPSAYDEDAGKKKPTMRYLSFTLDF